MTNEATNPTANVTELERKMIANIGDNDFANGDPTAHVWSNCLDCGPFYIDPKQFGGIISSLIKKGLAGSDGWNNDESCCWLTEDGVKVFHQTYPEQK